MKFINSVIERKCSMRGNLEIHAESVNNLRVFLWMCFLPNRALDYQPPCPKSRSLWWQIWLMLGGREAGLGLFSFNIKLFLTLFIGCKWNKRSEAMNQFAPEVTCNIWEYCQVFSLEQNPPLPKTFHWYIHKSFTISRKPSPYTSSSP